MIELAEQHDWVVGFMDEVWWSRFALPNMRVWQDEIQPIYLLQPVARPADPEPKALACYGLWCPRQEQMLLRFVDGRPVSHVTTAFLEWATAQLAQQGQRVLVLIWDNASWHVSLEVREWIAGHNQQAKSSGVGVRIIVVGLPVKSPWLNNIEPKWGHGKKAIVEPERELSAAEVEERVCSYFKVRKQPHLVQVKKEKQEQQQERVAKGGAAAQPTQEVKTPRPTQAPKTQKVA